MRCTSCFAFLACVLAGPATMVAAEPEEPPPWHLVDLWWDLGEERPFESYSVDVEIEGDLPADVNLYVAPIGLAHLNGTAFYGGLQTQADGHTKQSPRLRKIGRGMLMSMWGERSLDAIRPPLGGFCQSSGHEGDFVSVRRPYEWRAGRHTYRVVRMDREEIEGQAYTWVGAFLHNHAADEHVFIGALRFPGADLQLSRQTAAFVEIYGARIPVADIPRATVTFGPLRINGEEIPAPPATAVYPRGVPDYAAARAEDGRIVVEVGELVEVRKERRVELGSARK